MSEPIDPAAPRPAVSLYDPGDREAQQNPFPAYAALRRHAPVYHHPESGLYLVSRMAEVQEVLAAPRRFSSRGANRGTPPSAAVVAELRAIFAGGLPVVDTLLTADPPRQTRYRKVVGRAFSTRAVNALEPRIRATCRALLDAWPREGRVDFMASLALPLPIRVIADTLGMPPDMEADIKRWSDDSVAALGVDISDARRLEAARGTVESHRYWQAQFDACRRLPRNDIVSDLVHTRFEDADGDARPLEDAELASLVLQLMVAGNETTTKLLNETARILCEDTPAWERLRREPGLIPAAVEELLRLASPNQGLFRVATEDCELAGVPIPKGARLWVLFGSANRDESVFPEPDRFDPTRENLRDHVAFGRGAHFCIGAPLARLEMRVFLEELIARFARLAPAPGFAYEYEPSHILRGLVAMEIEVAAA